MKSNRYLIGQSAGDYTSGRYTLQTDLDTKLSNLRRSTTSDVPIGGKSSGITTVEEKAITDSNKDPYFGKVSLLINGEGTYSPRMDGSDYGHNLIPNGDLRTTAASPMRRGRFSWRTPDSSYQSNYVSVTQKNNCFPIANGNWTFEFWARMNYFFNDAVRWFDTGNNSDAGAIVFGSASTGNFSWGRPTAGSGVGTSNAPVKMGQWHHYVVSSEGGGVGGRIFIDGVLQGYAGYTNMTANDRSMRIGNQNVAANWSVPDMQLADFRFFSQNVYPYGSNVTTVGTQYFVPDPNPPETNLVTWDGGQSYKKVDSCELHTFADSILIDRSKNNLVVTQSGTSPYITAESPYTDLYSETSTNYGVYFDGTGDYISTSEDISSDFTSTDFTMEMWWYVPNTTGGCLCGAPNFELYLTGGALAFVQQGGYNYVSTLKPVVGQWNHLGVTRTGSTWYFFLNGQVETSGSWTSTSALSPGGTTFIIGGSYYSSTLRNPVSGHISNFRYVDSHISTYASTYAIPTAPLTAITGTKLLTCQDKNLKDNSTNAYTMLPNGDARTTSYNPFDSGQSPGKYSAYFDGGSDYLAAASSDDFNFGTNDLTIECWCKAAYPTQDTARMVSVNYNAWGSGSIFFGRHPAAGVDGRMAVLIYNYSTGAALLYDPNYMTEDWHHYAVVRSGNDWTLYRDGTSVATATWSGSVNTAAGIWQLGGNTENSGNYAWWGHLSNYRLVNGTAVYTSNFTPPTGPLAAITNTKLLAFQNANLLDASGNHDLTITGGVRSSPVSPFTESAVNSYSKTMSKVEKDTSGMLFFDGGDYIEVQQNTSLDPGANDFTIEGWIHPAALSGTQAVLSKADNGYGSFLIQSINGNQLVFYSDEDGGTNWSIANGQNIGSIVINRWYHFAVTRKGNTFRTFLNGVQGATWTSSATLYNSAKRVTIGSNGAAAYWNGYISDIRMVLGTSLYDCAFIPSTNPLEKVDGTALLALNSKYGFRDYEPVNEVGNRPSYINRTTGDPVTGTFSPFSSGSWSGYFDGNGDYITGPTGNSTLNTALDILGSDYTMEWWMFKTANTAQKIVTNFTASGGNGFDIITREDGAISITTWTNNSPSSITSTFFNYNINEWVHVAIVKNSGSYYFYVNGEEVGIFQGGSRTAPANPGAGTGLAIGVYIQNLGYPAYFNGYMSNLRIVKGTAIYTSNFAPPTAPLTAITGTVLLTCQDNRFVDRSMYNTDLTSNGEVKTLPFSPFSEKVVPKTYSTYFDGTADEIETTSAIVSSTEYSIEAWVYPTLNQQGYIAAQYTAGNGSRTVFLYRESNTNLYFFHPSVGSVGAIPLALNTWYHVAITRDSGGRTRMFVDGVLKHTFTTSYTPEASSFSFGGNGEAGSNFGGYISNMRVLNGSIPGEYQTTGTTVDTQIFNPPTGPVTAITNTVLLTCQSSYNKDDSGYQSVLSGSGNPRVVEFNPFGYDTETYTYDPEIHGGSTYLDGGDYWQIEKSERNLTMYKGDFTVEVWVRPLTSSSTQQRAFLIYGNTIDVLTIYYTSSTGDVGAEIRSTSQGSTVLTSSFDVCKLGVWTHIAAEREGTNWRLYVNGKLEASATISASASLNEFQDNWFHQPRIGAASNTDKYFVNGHIGPLRITKEAVYKGVGFVPTEDTFAPHKNEVTRIKWTSSNILGATGKNLLEMAGDVVTRKTPAPSEIARSFYFDGTSTLKDFSGGQTFIGTTGDFTVEAWVYPNDTGEGHIFTTNYNTNSYASFRFYTNNKTISVYISTTGSSWQQNINIADALELYQWNHVALVRDGGNFHMFANGTKVWTTTGIGSGTALATPGTETRVGAILYSGSETYASFNGYMADLRVVNGTALYTENFTPPREPLETISGTTLHLFNNGSKADKSSYARTYTEAGSTGDVTVTGLSPYFAPSLAPNKCYYFDGSGDYIKIPETTPNLAFPGDFTIEHWALFDDISVQRNVWDTRISTGTETKLAAYYDVSTGKYKIYYNAADTITSTETIVAGKWYHFALVRSSGVVTLYVDGVASGSTWSLSTALTDADLTLGARYDGANSMSGYIDDFRVTKVARYTSDFVPPVKLPTR